MSSLNRVFLAGNLTRNPEVKQTGAGQTVADLGLAVNERYTSKTGETVEKTCFADVVVWGRQAEACGAHLVKGAPVLVEGCLQLDRWTTEDGAPRSKMRVRALRVQFLGRRADADADTAAAMGAAAAAPVGAVSSDDDIPF